MNAIQQFLNQNLTRADRNVSDLTDKLEQQKYSIGEAQKDLERTETELVKAKFMAENLRRIHDAEMTKAE